MVLTFLLFRTFSPSMQGLGWFFVWCLLSLTAIPQLALNRKCYHESKLEMELHIINTVYMRHCACAHEQKWRYFHTKMTRAKLYIYIEVGLGTKETWRWTYSALRYFFTNIVFLIAQINFEKDRYCRGLCVNFVYFQISSWFYLPLPPSPLSQLLGLYHITDADQTQHSPHK